MALVRLFLHGTKEQLFHYHTTRGCVVGIRQHKYIHHSVGCCGRSWSFPSQGTPRPGDYFDLSHIVVYERYMYGVKLKYVKIWTSLVRNCILYSL